MQEVLRGNQQKNLMVVRMYNDWRNYRNNSPNLEDITCNIDDLTTVTNCSLTSAICRFITEVKKVDRSEFPGHTLYDIIICLQFHLETQGLSWKLLNDSDLTEIRFTLDNMMKLHTSQGVGIKVRETEVLSDFDEELLWNLGLLGTTSPSVLLNTVVFLLERLCFACRQRT